MQAGEIVSIAAMLISFIALILNSRKDTRADAAQNATIQTKLDSVKAGVDEIRVDLRSMQASLSDHSERLVLVEAKVDNNSNRLDKLEGKHTEG